jgi:hypothetical protein
VERRILVATLRDRSLSPLANTMVRHLFEASREIEAQWSSVEDAVS